MITMTLHEAALAYAERGWAVFPLAPGTKKPLAGSRGFLDASTDPRQINEWWTVDPTRNIGIATGKTSGITVLDVDMNPAKGKQGMATLLMLIGEHGEVWPDTMQQRTWSGGRQYFFAYDKRVPNRAKVGDLLDLDTRNDGGYVVAPPSIVSEGGPQGTYTWVTATPLARMPESVVQRLTQGSNGGGSNKKPRTDAEWAKTAKGVPSGSRQSELPSICGKLIEAHGPGSAFAREQAHAWAERCEQGEGALTPEAVDKCFDNIEAKEIKKRERRSMISATPALEKTSDDTSADTSDDPGGERYTDTTNAKLLAAVAKDDVRHADEMKDSWFIWDKHALSLQAATAVYPFVEIVAHNLFVEANELEAQIRSALGLSEPGDLEEQVKGMMKADETGAVVSDALRILMDRMVMLRMAAHRLESVAGAEATIKMAKAHPTLRIRMDALDQHPYWLNTPGETLDLETGESWAPRIADLLTKVTGARYDSSATCPRWDAFLAEVLPDLEVRAFLQRSVGIALTDNTMERCLWFLWGTGKNGKSTFLDALREVLGQYASNADASTLMRKEHGNTMKNDIAKLRGARFVSASEAEEGDRLAESLIKQMTGGTDPLTVRKMYADYFDFVPTFKIFLATNHKPNIKGTDPAIWDRIHLVDFTVRIADEKVDRDLPATLAAEKSGILNWAIAGYRDWKKDGLRVPASVRASTASYKEEMDSMGNFLADECVIGDDRFWVATADLYRVYQAWCLSNGVRFPLTQIGLSRQCQDRGFRAVQKTTAADRARGLAGIKLRQPWR
jgi:putative DNA primase/helicase